MASLRFYDLSAGCPTNAGALLFAKEPLHWIPGASIQFVRWAGTTMADDAVAARRFTGDLVTVLREIDSFISLPIQSLPAAESTLRERSETDYPPVAIRELLLNAIMQRSYESNSPVHFYWYDDRIEIQNSGGLYGMASPENFPKQTDYRNPVIDCFKWTSIAQLTARHWPKLKIRHPWPTERLAVIASGGGTQGRSRMP